MRVSAFETGEGSVSADRDPPSGASRHLLPQGEKGRWGHLWDSYNVLIALVSKTYASGGTSRRSSEGRSSRPRDPGRTRDPVAQEYPMLDILMLALGLGFFVAGIGYAYACERL